MPERCFLHILCFYSYEFSCDPCGGHAKCDINSEFVHRLSFQEHKKILYYHPPDVDIDTKIKNVGLCEAVVKFTE